MMSVYGIQLTSLFNLPPMQFLHLWGIPRNSCMKEKQKKYDWVHQSAAISIPTPFNVEVGQSVYIQDLT